MLYWTCPECGRECSPEIRECPVCASAKAAPSSPNILVANGHSSSGASTIALLEEEPKPPSSGAIDSLVRPLVESAAEPTQLALPGLESLAAAQLEAEITATAAVQSVASAPAEASVESVAPVAAPIEAVPPVASAPAELVAPVAPPTEAPAQAPAESVALVAAPTEAVPPVASAPAEAPVESVALVAAPIEAVQAVASAPAEALVESVAPVASAPAEEPIPAATEPTQPAPSPSPEASVESALVAPPGTGTQTQLSAALTLQAEAVLDAIALQAEVEQSAILTIRHSFGTPLKTSLLTAPLKLVTAPAPPAEQWKRTGRPFIRSLKPNEAQPALMTAGPQNSALAGPCLPRELRTFVEDQSPAKIRPGKRAGFPGWIVSVLVATFLFLAAGSILQYVSGNRDAKAAAASGQAVVERQPFARFVEVTGLRVIADLNHKSQLQYIVVNHSSTQISGMPVKIAVRSAAGSSETAPLFVVSTIVPSLAPYQSKELRTELDAAMRSSTIPDWQNLRADVQVSTPQE